MSTFIIYNQAESIQYANLVKGDLRMSVVIPSDPATGNNRRWGFYSLDKTSGAYFDITDAVFTVNAFDGYSGNSESIVVNWEHFWSGKNTTWRVVWQAGLIFFYVNGVQKAVIGLNQNDVVLASSPLSVYIKNLTNDNVLLGNIDGIGIQSYSYTYPYIAP